METENNQIPNPTPESQEPKSYAEWLAKFYPTDAKEFAPAEDDEDNLYFFSEADELGLMSKEQKAQEISALKHSIRKWEGLRPETLREYKVYYSVNSCVFPAHRNPKEFVCDSYPHLYIDYTSCALCALKAVKCEDCSIGGYLASTEETLAPHEELNCLGQFGEMLRDKNPEPMISLLNETLKWVEGLETGNE